MNLKWPEQLQKWKGALGKYQSILLVIAVGALLLLLPSGSSKNPEPEKKEEQDTFCLEKFESRLEDTLSQIQGAGKTQVVLTLDSGSRRVLAQDVEREPEGGSTSTVVTVGKGSGGQDVVSLQTVAPKFRGALVVCPGGSDPQTRLRLTEAVSALTGLSSNRISICAGNT